MRAHVNGKPGHWWKAASMLWLAALLVAGAATPAAFASESRSVVVISVDAAVTPASADYITRGIRKAQTDQAALVVLKLDTPGGLDTSMRTIIKAILASPVPVATSVAPDGARAASAGTYILYASHFAAMAPATNLGAATPVNVGIGDDGGKDVPAKDAEAKESRPASSRDSMRSKQINDAAAYIRGLAELRGRNGEWAERAVREAVSLSATEAQRLKVVDVVAADLPGLLKQLDGRRTSVAGQERVLDLKGAVAVEVPPDWRTQLLMVITNPSIALILMMIGIYGLIFEFMSPGFVLPGVLGGIALLIALYAFQLLPINYAGMLLILLGIAFIVAEAFVPSFGALGIGGVAALAIGMVILIDPDTAPGLHIPVPLIAGTAIAMSLAAFGTAYMAAKLRGRRVVTGREQMISAEGVALEEFALEGWVQVQGERWRARSATPLLHGDRVRVTAMSGLSLTVEKI